MGGGGWKVLIGGEKESKKKRENSKRAPRNDSPTSSLPFDLSSPAPFLPGLHPLALHDDFSLLRLRRAPPPCSSHTGCFWSSSSVSGVTATPAAMAPLAQPRVSRTALFPPFRSSEAARNDPSVPKNALDGAWRSPPARPRGEGGGGNALPPRRPPLPPRPSPFPFTPRAPARAPALYRRAPAPFPLPAAAAWRPVAAGDAALALAVGVATPLASVFAKPPLARWASCARALPRPWPGSRRSAPSPRSGRRRSPAPRWPSRSPRAPSRATMHPPTCVQILATGSNQRGSDRVDREGEGGARRVGGVGGMAGEPEPGRRHGHAPHAWRDPAVGLPGGYG